jgi:hypothetical protein
MWWLWIVGPLAVAIIYVLTGLWTNPRYRREVEAWRAAMGERLAEALNSASDAKKPASRKKKKDKKRDLRPRQVSFLPRGFGSLLQSAGGGRAIGHYELIGDLAYVFVAEANISGTSDHQTVLLRLEKPAPRLIVRPLSNSEGELQSNRIQFNKDPAFMEAFYAEVHGAQAKAAGKWLSKPLRETLCETPEVWLRVEGTFLAATIYGEITAKRIAALVELADVFCAEHGAMDGPSLFGETNVGRSARGAAEDEDEEEEGDEEEEEEDEDDEEDAPTQSASKSGP